MSVVPANRLAVFRVALALTTLCFHLPQTDAMVYRYEAVSFHVPLFSYVPPLPAALAGSLILLRHVAAWALLLGLFSRTAAAVLSASGFYIVAIDVLHYRHHVEFHLVLLILLVLAADGVTLRRLIYDHGEPTPLASGLPETLLRVQIALVFAFAALDKLASPFWVQSGAMLSEVYAGGDGAGLLLRGHTAPFSWLQALNQTVVSALPRFFSWVTVGVELVIAASFLFPRWRYGAAFTLLFAAYLEFSVIQYYYAWDIVAAVILLLPAGDGAYAVVFDEKSTVVGRFRALIASADWMGRLRWIPRAAWADQRGSLGPIPTEMLESSVCLVTPGGHVTTGYAAIGRLLPLLAGPVFVAMSLLRLDAGAGGDPVSGRTPPTDALLWSAALLLAFFSTRASGYVVRPLYSCWLRWVSRTPPTREHRRAPELPA